MARNNAPYLLAFLNQLRHDNNNNNWEDVENVEPLTIDQLKHAFFTELGTKVEPEYFHTHNIRSDADKALTSIGILTNYLNRLRNINPELVNETINAIPNDTLNHVLVLRHVNILNFLLDNGLNVNTKIYSSDGTSHTMWELALISDDINIIHVLSRHGADGRVRQRRGPILIRRIAAEEEAERAEAARAEAAPVERAAGYKRKRNTRNNNNINNNSNKRPVAKRPAKNNKTRKNRKH